MKSVLGANEKPNCLIIDEIDGAPAVRPTFNFIVYFWFNGLSNFSCFSFLLFLAQAAINILLATLNRKDSREGEESGVNALKKKKKKQSVLLRPIICICNDL